MARPKRRHHQPGRKHDEHLVAHDRGTGIALQRERQHVSLGLHALRSQHHGCRCSELHAAELGIHSGKAASRSHHLQLPKCHERHPTERRADGLGNHPRSRCAPDRQLVGKHRGQRLCQGTHPRRRRQRWRDARVAVQSGPRVPRRSPNANNNDHHDHNDHHNNNDGSTHHHNNSANHHNNDGGTRTRGALRLHRSHRHGRHAVDDRDRGYLRRRRWPVCADPWAPQQRRRADRGRRGGRRMVDDPSRRRGAPHLCR